MRGHCFAGPGSHEIELHDRHSQIKSAADASPDVDYPPAPFQDPEDFGVEDEDCEFYQPESGGGGYLHDVTGLHVVLDSNSLCFWSLETYNDKVVGEELGEGDVPHVFSKRAVYRCCSHQHKSQVEIVLQTYISQNTPYPTSYRAA